MGGNTGSKRVRRERVRDPGDVLHTANSPGLPAEPHNVPPWSRLMENVPRPFRTRVVSTEKPFPCSILRGWRPARKAFFRVIHRRRTHARTHSRTNALSRPRLPRSISEIGAGNWQGNVYAQRAPDILLDAGPRRRARPGREGRAAALAKQGNQMQFLILAVAIQYYCCATERSLCISFLSGRFSLQYATVGGYTERGLLDRRERQAKRQFGINLPRAGI